MQFLPSMALVGLALLTGLPGCKKKPPPAPATPAPAARPASVTSILSLRHPQRTADELSRLSGRLSGRPYPSGAIFGLLLRHAGLPAALIDVVDRGRPWHLLSLDGQRLEQSEPAVIVLPIRSREALIDALQRRMKRVAANDGLLTYRARGGGPDAGELRLAIGAQHVAIPSGLEAHRQTRAFIETRLLRRVPEHDVELHVFYPGDGGERDPARLRQQVERTVQRLRRRLNQRGRVADEASERTVRRLVALLSSARALRLTADLSKEALVLALRASGQRGGRLATLIKRQRPGDPLGQALLPPRPWLIFADRGNPGARQEGGWLVPLVETLVEGPQRAAIVGEARRLAESLSGDLTLVLHRPASGGGLALAAVARSLDAEGSRRALAALIRRLGRWLGDEARQRGDSGAVKVDRRPIATPGATGEIFHFGFAEATPGSTVRRFFGERPSFAWASIEETVLFAAGREGEQQLRQMLSAAAGKPRAERLADDKGFAAARGGAGRVGLCYLSLVELLRSWPDDALGTLRPAAASLAADDGGQAPHLSWGVDGRRREIDFTLHLPLEHLLQLEPALRAMARQPLPSLPSR
jgi:hypothetical protein